jgi:sugar phosphate isomerase/epimerase
MRFSYVLPAPSSYGDWAEFDRDLACMKQAGYDAVELQIPDPAQLDEQRLGESLAAVKYNLCAFQTGSTYATRGNCLCTADKTVRRRTVDLLKSFVDLATRWNSVVVFGTLQGRLKDEPDRRAGSERIVEALREIGEQATQAGVVIAFEPVNHGEVGFHNTIAEASALVRRLNLPGVRLMIDTFHMNIEERDMLGPLAGVADILAHVHLSETNRDVLGAGHWPTKEFLRELDLLGYAGFCSIGVYNTTVSRRQSIRQCATWLSSQCGVLHAS